MGIKELILKKGWAGATISREETIARINPLVRDLAHILHSYSAALQGQTEDGVSRESMKRLRADIGKLSEIVLSCGGVADAGAGSTDAPNSKETSWKELENLEAKFLARIDAEKEVEHQMRTRAILDAVRSNTADRARMVRNLA